MYRIKNWNLFQHYKDRKPPWIKLHMSLLSDDDYLALSSKAKIVLIHCWMAAAERWKPGKEVEPLLPCEPSLLRLALRLRQTLCLVELESSGYLIKVSNDYNNLICDDASETVADCTTEAEVKAELEEPKSTAQDLFKILEPLLTQVKKLYPKFNTHSWIQKTINKDGFIRPDAVWQFVLTRVVETKGNIKSIWAYTDKIYSIEAGNVEASTNEKEHEERKESFADMGLGDIVGGMD